LIGLRGDLLLLGRVNGVFGLRGEVRLFLYNRETKLFSKWRNVVLLHPDGTKIPTRLKSRPGAGKRILGVLEGVETPEAAAALHGVEICIHPDRLPQLDEDTWYHHELLGLPVRTEGGTELGAIVEIVSSGEVDLWVVQGNGEEHYIPNVREEVLLVTPGDCVIVAGD